MIQGAPNAADDDGTEVDELRVAILGRPNVGKSSLLNRLTASDRAIVSDIAGQLKFEFTPFPFQSF